MFSSSKSGKFKFTLLLCSDQFYDTLRHDNFKEIPFSTARHDTNTLMILYLFKTTIKNANFKEKCRFPAA